MVVDVESGRVRDAYMERSTGHAILDDTAVNAFRRWRFKPGTVNKVRVPITFAVPTRIHPRRWYPFQGVVRAVNAKAGTMTVQGPTGTDPIVLTSDTGVVKNGKRASLSDIATGDSVRGSATVRPPHFRATAKWINITASLVGNSAAPRTNTSCLLGCNTLSSCASGAGRKSSFNGAELSPYLRAAAR
jgi:hypothetical protein